MTAPNVLVLLSINLIIYFRTLSYKTVIDDIEWATQSIAYPYYLSRYSIPEATFRFLKDRLYGAYTFGQNLTLDHAFTLALHITTAILLGLYSHSLLTAIFYSVHPCNHQTAIWLNARRFQVLNILILVMLLTHAIYLLPLLLIPIVEHLVVRNNQRRTLYRIQRPPLTHAVIVLKSLGFNVLKLTGLITPMSLYPFLEGESISQLTRFNGYASIGLITVTTLITTHPIILILLLLGSSTIPYTQTCADRYLSLPLLFICPLVAQACNKEPVIAAMLLPLYLIQSVKAQRMYVDIQSFYDYHANEFPQLKKLPLLKSLYPSLSK